MGRYRYSNRSEADSLKKISISFLKEKKYLEDSSYKGGSVIWTSNGWSEDKSSVGINVSTINNFLRIYYTQTNNNTGEKQNFDYKIPLVTTPCNYGGKRYWFICSMYKNGNYCGRRVGKLYKDGDYFACRHCYNLTYASRRLSGYSKIFGDVCLPDIEKAKEKIKQYYYKGNYTKNYLRYLKLNNKFDNVLIGMSNYLTKNLPKKHS